MLGTYLTRHTQYPRAELVQNFYASNPAFEERFRMLVAGFQAKGAPLMEAQQCAYAALGGEAERGD